MNKVNLKEKVLDLESKLEILKKSLIQEPDFDVDERNWERLKEGAKNIRRQLYRERYVKK